MIFSALEPISVTAARGNSAGSSHNASGTGHDRSLIMTPSVSLAARRSSGARHDSCADIILPVNSLCGMAV